jgi:TFIIF-interacting CTD phosphatase-like protein
VLDLDETLVHWDENNETLEVRPYAEEFLQIMNKYYELVIFTAGVQSYADWAIDQISCSDLIAHRLYR